MRFSALILSSVAPTLIAAHGKIAVVAGDAGGNGTAIGIQGGVIPGPGKNKVTEPDTTVFAKTNIATDGLGKTNGQGPNTVAMLADTMAQSGNMLPQVSDGGMITGTFHIVTTDGAGPVSAMIDPSGTGAFAAGVPADVMQDVPGNKGNIKANGQVPRSIGYWALRARGLVKRASNVNMDFPIAVQVPAGMTCSGTAAGVQNVCLMKIANSNNAGPFGGVIAFQMNNGSVAPVAAAASTNAGAATQGGAGTAGTGLTPAANGNGQTQGTAGTGSTTPNANGQTQGTAGTSSSTTNAQSQSGSGTGALPAGNANGQTQGGAGTAGSNAVPGSNNIGTGQTQPGAGSAGSNAVPAANGNGQAQGGAGEQGAGAASNALAKRFVA